MKHENIPVAVASHDILNPAFQESHVSLDLRFPSELLLEIFLMLSDKEVTLPPILTQSPWVLGRVCSRWRSISRSDPRLWGCPLVSRTSDLYKPGRAFSILPPVVPLSLRVHRYFRFLIPYLHRCKVLDMSAHMSSFDDFWLAPIPHNAFNNLYHLSLHIDDSVNLQNPFTSRTKWGSAAGVLRMASQLRSVSISSYSSWSSIFLSMGIPWNQLTHLQFEGLSDIPAFYKVLRQCNSLVRLNLRTFSSYDSHPELSNELQLDHLHLSVLQVSGYGDRPSWIPPLHNWECLTNLVLSYSYPADYLQDMLQKCKNLAHLSFQPPRDFPLIPLSLPSIRTISMVISSSGHLSLSNLVLPSLENLTICDFADMDLSYVCVMLENSQCHLSNFVLRSHSPSVIPRDFLLSISSVASESIEVLMPEGRFSTHILNDMALGTLLPKFVKLVCIPDSVEAMLEMLEARVDWQVQHWDDGPKTLYISTGHKNMSVLETERFNNLHLRVPNNMDMKIQLDINYSFCYRWCVMFQSG